MDNPIIYTQHLLYRVLERALIDATTFKLIMQGSIRVTAKERRDARRWLFKRIRLYKPEWSFAWICEHLGLCPYTLQKEIKLAIHKKTCYARKGNHGTMNTFVSAIEDLDTYSINIKF